VAATIVHLDEWLVMSGQALERNAGKIPNPPGMRGAARCFLVRALM
jgi:hypothetical protein